MVIFCVRQQCCILLRLSLSINTVAVVAGIATAPVVEIWCFQELKRLVECQLLCWAELIDRRRMPAARGLRHLLEIGLGRRLRFDLGGFTARRRVTDWKSGTVRLNWG